MDLDPQEQVFENIPKSETHNISHEAEVGLTEFNTCKQKFQIEGHTVDQIDVNQDDIFRMLAENSTDIIWILDIKTLMFTYISPSMFEICGFTPEEVISMPLSKILTPDSYSRALLKIQEGLRLDRLQEIEPDHIFLLEFEEYCKDGSTISAEARMRFVRDQSGSPIRVYGITRDVTERKQMENALRASEMRFSALFDNSPVPIIELDCSRISKYFDELRNQGIKDFRTYFDTNPKEVAVCTSLISVSSVNHTSVEFFDAGSKEGVITGMPDYFLAQSQSAYREELIALAEGAIRFENETPVHIMMRGDLTVFHILSVVPGYEQTLERVLVSFIDVTHRAEMYNREHNIANILQRALLPAKIPHIPGCDISVEYLPALEEAQVGGDFYDIFQLSNGKVGILIGDVIGKGLAAADRVAAARYTIRSYAYIDADPSRVLSLANNALCRERGNDIYDSLMLAAFFAVLDVDGCSLEYASGGNEPPLLISADGTLQELNAEGHMMGIWRDHKYCKESCEIRPGDKILMMTDGIIEAKSASLQQFGPEGVVSYLSNNYKKSSKELTSGILQTTMMYAGGSLQDDAIIIAIAVNCA